MKRKRSNSVRHSNLQSVEIEDATIIPDTVIPLILLYVTFRDLCNLELTSKIFRFHCLRRYRTLKFIDLSRNRPLSVVSRSAFNSLIDKLKIYAPNLNHINQLSSIADRFTSQNLGKLTNFAKLSRIDFVRIDVDCVGFNNFVENAANLRHLSLICVTMKNNEDRFFKKETYLSNLEVLELACIQFCRVFLRSLSCTKLRVFKITRQSSYACPIALLDQILNRNSDLEHLNLQDMQHLHGFMYIASLPKLKRLFIDNQYGPAVDIDWFISRDQLENTHLEEFKMNCKNSSWFMHSQKNTCILPILKYSKNLKRLGFHVQQNMDDIWPQLMAKVSLETIFISQHCRVGQPIFGLLQQLPNLKELVLFDVPLLENDVQLLSSFPCLKRLEFDNVAERNAEILSIVRHLPSSLTVFTYRFAPMALFSITDSMIVILVNRCPNLEILSLSSLSISKLAFGEIQRKLKHLRVIRMNFNDQLIATQKLISKLTSEIMDHLIIKISNLNCLVVNGRIYQHMIENHNIWPTIRLRNMEIHPWDELKLNGLYFDEFDNSLFSY